MPFSKQKHILIPLFLLTTLLGSLWLGTALAQEIRQKTLSLTVTSPSTTKPVPVNAEVDPVLLPAGTFPVRAVAQPGKFVNLYGWTIVPGTDGNANEDQVLTNFEATVITPGTVEFSWQPRTLFRQEYVDAESAQAGLTCERLKTHCLPEEGEFLGEASVECTEGNVPSDLDCSLPKKFSVYHDHIRPHLSISEEADGQLSLGFEPPLDETELVETTKNNTLLLASECEESNGCEFDHYAAGWRYGFGPLPLPSDETETPLLNDDLSPLEMHSFNVDEVNGHVPSIDGVGNPWAPDLIFSEDYAPNITQNQYSGAYFFSYWNYVRAYNYIPARDEEYTVFSLMPIKDQTVLIDGFDQYEIYAVEDSVYETQKGVTQENGTLVQVIRDPSLTTSALEYSSVGLDANKTYHFAIFEVREHTFPRLPDFLTEEIEAKEVTAENCIGNLLNPASCNALVGHLISSDTELKIAGGSGEVEEQVSPPKIEYEIYEQQGAYTADPFVSDRNGELRCGVNGYDICEIPTQQMNRFAPQHFIAGTYTASDALSGETDKTFFISANRSSTDLFNPYVLTGKTAAVRQSENMYGVVFDSWTKEIRGDVTVALNGVSAERKENIELRQETASDGLLAFTVENGEYFLEVQALADRYDLFLFPSSEYSPGAETCGDDDIFTDLYCDKELPIAISEGAVHRDIPLDPPIQGSINTAERVKIILTKNGVEVATAWNLPNERFSFWVPPGSYEIKEVQNIAGETLKVFDKTVSVPADAHGKPANTISVSLSL